MVEGEPDVMVERAAMHWRTLILQVVELHGRHPFVTSFAILASGVALAVLPMFVIPLLTRSIGFSNIYVALFLPSVPILFGGVATSGEALQKAVFGRHNIEMGTPTSDAIMARLRRIATG